MACGAPVVVSDRGALPEVVGKAGIVVPPTGEAVTDALRDLLTNPDRAAAPRGRGRCTGTGFHLEPDRERLAWRLACRRGRNGMNAEVRPVTVAVVSWNTRELLLRCLSSLARDVESGLASVWVVDNGSTDGSLEAARKAAPWAEVVNAGENLGFGRAVNRVAERTESPWIVAANADVAPEPGALATLVEAGHESEVGCVAPRLILPNGETQHSAYPFPTIPSRST